jgi:SAM-dependent methyltransferase
MMGPLRVDMFREDLYRKIFKFNQHERDRWVFEQADSLPSGSRLLDVGAGSCPYRSYFRHCEYKTHDFTELEKEQLIGNSGYGQIDYVSDIVCIPVKDASFDAILCTEVLEHVPEPIRAIKEFARILKPGGTLFLTAPLGSGIHQNPYHFYGGYTPYWYRKFLTENNFEGIKIEANGGFFKHFGQESIRFAKVTAPWRIDAHRRWQLCWTPFWMILLPWFLFFLPAICNMLDPLDRPKFFTVGYHVVARKAEGRR